MMSNLGMSGKVPATAMAIVAVLFFVAEAKQAPQRNIAEIVRGLRAEDSRHREKALRELNVLRAEVRDALLKNLRELGREPERVWGSSYHFTVLALGSWRFESSVWHLMRNIDFALDTSDLPSGAFYGPESFYPAAQALARIGEPGKAVQDRIFDRLAQPTDEKVLRACTWVLWRTIGRERAALIVESRRKVAHGEAKQNLAAVLEFLKSPTEILLIPERGKN